MDVNFIYEHTKVLADYLFDTNFEDFSDEVLDNAKLAIADTIGVAFKGSLEPEMEELYKRIPKGGKTILFMEGLPRVDDIAMASFANATATAFVELDAVTLPSYSHTALHVFFPTFAYAQYIGKSGADFLTAFILGCEIQSRVDEASKLRHKINKDGVQERSSYTHGHSGHIGAVVAVGKLLGWNSEQFRQAINFMASVPLATSWTPCFTDSSVSSTFGSFASYMAFIVKDLIESGFTGYEGALYDTYTNIIGEEFNPFALTDGLGLKYAITNNIYKFHSSCAFIHSAIEAAADALNYPLKHDEYPLYAATEILDTDKIKSIKVYASNYQVIALNNSPEHKQASKFSLPFALAAYLVKGAAGPDMIGESVLSNDQVRSLEKRISFEFDPNLNDNGDPIKSMVSIELNDGKILNGKCKEIYGWPRNPANKIDIYNKFIVLTDDILGENNKDVWSFINNIEKQENISQIFSKINTNF